MINPFFIRHHEIVLQCGCESIDPKTLDLARGILCRKYTIPSRSIITTTDDADAHARFYLIQLGNQLELVDSKIKPMDRELLEICYLFSMKKAHDYESRTKSEKRSFLTLGTLIQHKLTCFILNMNQKILQNIFKLGQTTGIPEVQHLWELTFIGAASCARAIETFLNVPGARVFLPTIHEDVDTSIDFIVMYPPKQNEFCVSVKSGPPGKAIYVEYVSKKPRYSDNRMIMKEQRQIFDGTVEFNEEYDRDAGACRLVVGKTNNDNFDTNVYQDDVASLSDFLNRKHQPFIDEDSTGA